MMEHWLPSHRGRRSRGGPPSAATVLAHLSLLSGLFQRLGRRAEYDAATGVGNPCSSPEVGDFRRAYPRLMARAGMLPLSAKPLAEGKYRALVAYLWGAYAACRCVLRRLVILRDLLCAQYMWKTSMRGHDTGKLSRIDFVDPRNPRRVYEGPPFTPAPGGGLVGPTHVCVAEVITKTYQDSRAPRVDLAADAEPAYCFIRTLVLYLSLCRCAEAPPGAALLHYLFKPLRSDRRGFKEEPLSSTALSARLRLHLTLAGLYEGEACHSFRRGTLQHAEANGLSREALLQFGQLRSDSTLRLYLDPQRHQAERPAKRRK